MRGHRGLSGRLAEIELTSRAVGAARLSELQLAIVDRARTVCLNTATTFIRSPIEQSDREDALVEWLERHGVDAVVADSLADTEISLKGLESWLNLLSPALACDS